MTSRSSLPWTAYGALIGALVCHYLIYAFRFMWYLDAANYDLLVDIYLVFVVVMIAEFFVFPRWWLMGATAMVTMFMPAIMRVNLLISPGFELVFVAAVSAIPFVGVSFLKARAQVAASE